MIENGIPFRVINGTKYRIVDTMVDISMPDSFVKNKMGSGHGESKYYVGNQSAGLLEFFDRFQEPLHCFFLKSDILEYLKIAKREFDAPVNKYRDEAALSDSYSHCLRMLTESDEMISFTLERRDVEPPRVYIAPAKDDVRSSNIWTYIFRGVALPGLSSCSIMKLQSHYESYYYFRLFFDEDIWALKAAETGKSEDKPDAAVPVVDTSRTYDAITRGTNQDDWKSRLLIDQPCCPFTHVDDVRLLIASHIKPYAKCENLQEKYDVENGFILSPLYDALFDKGLITFDDNKIMHISDWLSMNNRKRLNLVEGSLVEGLPPIKGRRKEYLQYHRDNVFKK